MMKKLPLPIKVIRRLFLSILELLWIPFYHLMGLLPRDKNLWIFVAWNGERYADNSRIFFEWVNKNHPEINAVWLTKSSAILNLVRSRGYKAYKNNSLKGIWIRIRVEKIFSVTRTELNFMFSKGAEHYALWHGMPLKKIGFDENINAYKNESKVKRLYSKILKTLYPWKKYFYEISMNNMTVSNSDFFTHIISSAFKIDRKKIFQTGSPRCDALFANITENLIEQIRGNYPDCKIIMYMPTFRTSMWTNEYFNPFSEKYGFEMEKFENLLEQNNMVFIYKPHFHDAKLMESKVKDKRFVTIKDDDFDELYNFVGQCDILMTDYSSIYFDFLAVKKPVILAPFDYEEYLVTSREHYFDYWENMEGVKIKNWDEFARVLDEKSYTPVSEETRLKYAEFLDGNCCEKLWEEIMKGEKSTI